MKLDGNTALLKSFSVKYLTNFDYPSIVQRAIINLSPYRVYIYRMEEEKLGQRKKKSYAGNETAWQNNRSTRISLHVSR